MYELTLVTNKYIYYNCEDLILMFDFDTRTICSDNYFAEEGYWSSVENIKNKKETWYWGEVPNPEED